MGLIQVFQKETHEIPSNKTWKTSGKLITIQFSSAYTRQDSMITIS